MEEKIKELEEKIKSYEANENYRKLSQKEVEDLFCMFSVFGVLIVGLPLLIAMGCGAAFVNELMTAAICTGTVSILTAMLAAGLEKFQMTPWYMGTVSIVFMLLSITCTFSWIGFKLSPVAEKLLK